MAGKCLKVAWIFLSCNIFFYKSGKNYFQSGKNFPKLQALFQVARIILSGKNYFQSGKNYFQGGKNNFQSGKNYFKWQECRISGNDPLMCSAAGARLGQQDLANKVDI